MIRHIINANTHRGLGFAAVTALVVAIAAPGASHAESRPAGHPAHENALPRPPMRSLPTGAVVTGPAAQAQPPRVMSSVPSVAMERSALAAGLRLTQILVAAGACGSKGEANRLIQGGGVYLNNRRISADGPVTESDLASDSMLVLRTGKKSYYLVRFSSL